MIAMQELKANCFQNVKEKSNFTCKNGNLDEVKEVLKEVDFSQFSTIKSKIQEAEEIIKAMDDKQSQLYKEIKTKKINKNIAEAILGSLLQKERMYRENVAWQKEILDPLKLALDKLSFFNNIGTKSAIFDEEQEIDFNKFQFKMLHGKKNMAEEKRLLKEISKRQDTAAIVTSTNRTVENLNRQISSLLWLRRSDMDEDWDRRDPESIKQLKQKREKVIANAVVNGKIWNSLGSKESILQQIKLKEKEAEELRKRQMASQAEIRQAEKELLAIEKEIDSLRDQYTEAYKEKEQACKSRFILLKTLEEMGGKYRKNQRRRRDRWLAKQQLLHSETSTLNTK